MRHFLVFGSHPLLSLAETKAVLGGRAPLRCGEVAIVTDPDHWDGQALQNRLAGTVKLGDVIAEMSVRDLTAERLADEIEARPRGERIEFGFTVYGGSPAGRERVQRLALAVKKELKTRGHVVRWVTGEEGMVTPAAVAKAGLTTRGYDFVLGLDEDQIFIGLTTHVQDADAWSLRDYSRPFRDMKTGMLPPKLARMMVNIGMGAKLDQSILDPFCGGGTTLMEAALMGATDMVGSDIAADQIAGSKQNMDWLVVQNLMTQKAREGFKFLVQPAETLNQVLKRSVNVIVTEGFLGRPLSGEETLITLEKNKQEVERVWEESLPVLAKLHSSGGRMVCAWPVYVTSHGVVAIDMKEVAIKAGYRVIDPLAGWVEKSPTLTYARSGQRVKRNIVVLERI